MLEHPGVKPTSCGWVTSRLPFVFQSGQEAVEDPVSCQGDSGPLGHQRDNPECDRGHRHNFQQSVPLLVLYLGGAGPCPQCLFFEHHREVLSRWNRTRWRSMRAATAASMSLGTLRNPIQNDSMALE